MENIKKFYDALSNDKAMQERAMALVKKGDKTEKTTPPFGHPSKEGNNEAAAKAAIVAFAKAEGFNFTEAELEAFAEQTKPLADEALETAVGGNAGCGCVMAGGGGGTDENGYTFACACPLVGIGDSLGPTGEVAEAGFCMCAGVGAGGAT